MELPVRNLMVRGKSLIDSLMLVAGSALANPPSVDFPTYDSVQSNSDPVRFLVDMFRSRASYLQDEDKQLYIQAVMTALNQTENGEIVDWWSTRNPANGHVRIVFTYPTGDGFCRVYQSEVIYKGNSQMYQERACVQQGVKGWRFYR